MEFTFGGEVTDRSAVVRMEDNVVVNIIVAPPTEPAPEGCFLVDISDGRFCDIGWTWDGTKFYNPSPAPAPAPVPATNINAGQALNDILSSNPDLIQSIPAIHDYVYVNGELVRQDMTISLPEAAPALQLLKDNFPNSIVNFESVPTNLIGVYGDYRPPYTNESISWYEMRKPPQEILDQYNIPENMYPDIYHWYGLKHDLTTKEVMLKVVFGSGTLELSNLPSIPGINESFYARLHHIDGTVEPYVDCYVNAPENEIMEFCLSNNIPFTSVADRPGFTWIYGVTFNYDTKEIITVKAYRRVDE